jgi:hypothetical protein
MLEPAEVRRLSFRLTQPYTIPENCPYLSEDQRELSELSLEGRAEWMAEWLRMAQDTRDEEDEWTEETFEGEAPGGART